MKPDKKVWELGSKSLLDVFSHTLPNELVVPQSPQSKQPPRMTSFSKRSAHRALELKDEAAKRRESRRALGV